MDLTQHALSVESRDDLADFVEALRTDLARDRATWENDTLDRYLRAAADWVRAMDGYFQNRGEAVPEQPTWGLVAAILAAARYYE